MPRNVQGPVGWVLEPLGLVHDIPAHGRGARMTWSLRSLIIPCPTFWMQPSPSAPGHTECVGVSCLPQCRAGRTGHVPWLIPAEVKGSCTIKRQFGSWAGGFTSCPYSSVWHYRNFLLAAIQPLQGDKIQLWETSGMSCTIPQLLQWHMRLQNEQLLLLETPAWSPLCLCDGAGNRFRGRIPRQV